MGDSACRPVGFSPSSPSSSIPLLYLVVSRSVFRFLLRYSHGRNMFASTVCQVPSLVMVRPHVPHVLFSNQLMASWRSSDLALRPMNLRKGPSDRSVCSSSWQARRRAAMTCPCSIVKVHVCLWLRSIPQS